MQAFLRKTVSMFLAVLMVLTLCPVAALAEGGNGEEVTGTTDEVKQYLITFMANGATVSARYVDEGQSIGALPSAPELEGFTFVRWYYKDTSSGVAVPQTVQPSLVVGSNLTVYAEYAELIPAVPAQNEEPAVEQTQTEVEATKTEETKTEETKVEETEVEEIKTEETKVEETEVEETKTEETKVEETKTEETEVEETKTEETEVEETKTEETEVEETKTEETEVEETKTEETEVEDPDFVQPSAEEQDLAEGERAYFLTASGSYLQYAVSGKYLPAYNTPKVGKASVSAPSGFTVLGSVAVNNLDSTMALALTLKLIAMPELEEGETLAFYALCGSKLSGDPILVDLSQGAKVTVDLDLTSLTGVALVSVAEPATRTVTLLVGDEKQTFVVKDGEAISDKIEVKEGMQLVGWRIEGSEEMLSLNAELSDDVTWEPVFKPMLEEGKKLEAGAVTISGLLPVKGSMVADNTGEQQAAQPQFNMQKSRGLMTAAKGVQGTEDGKAAEEDVREDTWGVGVEKELVSYDISIQDADGNPWQPEQPVNVTISDPSFGNERLLKVRHTNKDTGEVEEWHVKSSGNTVTFPASHFSVYVVVETVVPRLTVNFVNGSTNIATMYVKDADTEDEIKKIIYDPSAGISTAGKSFKGWATVDEYTKEGLMTIDDVRAAAMTRADGLSADDEVTYYAAVFNQYTITYVDAAGITVGSEVKEIPAYETEAEYTVNQGFSTDDAHNFEGWIVSEGNDHIKNYPAGAQTETVNGETVYYYTNGTEITITGSVKFSVDAPEGHWLVLFENGRGASYKAPRFIKSGETTSNEGLMDMVRNGYIFDNWYAEDQVTITYEYDTDGTVKGYTATKIDGATPYTFGQPITDTVNLYAIWTSNATADYTVLIWKQNVAGTGYDFVESVVKNASVGTTPTAVNATNGSVSGSTYAGETGFSFKETDQANKTVAPEGNTVVNVYWDRNEYTLTFQAPGNWHYEYTVSVGDNDNNPDKYGDVNGSKQRVYWRNGAFRTADRNNAPVYNGTVYTRDYTNWTTIKTITALYGADIRDNFPIVGTNGTTYAGASWQSQNSSIFDNGAYVSYIDTMQAESTTFRLVYNPQNNYYTYHVKYYVEALPGDTDTVSFNGRTFVLYHDAEIHFQSADLYSTESEEFTDITGYTKFGSYPAYENGQADFDNNYTISLYYTRNLYALTFMDGAYYDGNGNRITSIAGHNQLHKVNGIAYGANLTAYNKDGENYYEPDAPEEGFVFEGWYIDDACTHAYTFSTMAEGGIVVYAKWRQIQYRVFLHPNVPSSDTTLDWGSQTQQMNFRVSYGGKISVPTGIREGYEFYGWYKDADLTQVFTANEQIRGGVAYDKNVDMTDTMDKYGNGATTNADVNRFWITEKVDLYAKWSSVTVGADGIGIRYVKADGETTSSTIDTALYKDNTSVSAGSADVPTDNTKVFDHWVLQTWNSSNSAYEDTEITVLPGATFTALKSDAKITDATTGAVVAPSAVQKDGHYNYTIQLKAVYKVKEVETPTHIDWYSNYGSEHDGKGTLYHSDTGIKINEAVDILGPQTRAGYTFKGWTKTQGGTTADFLIWDGSKYTTTSGKTATQVAADEKQPYEDLFAVWEENEVTINYAVAADSTGMGTVDPTSEKVKVATGTAAGSTATPASSTYAFDYWTVDDGMESISTNAAFVPSKNSNGVYEEHTYYAHFKLNEATVTVHHYLKGTTTKVAEDTVTQETIGTEIDPTTIPVATEFLDTFEGYTLTKDSTDPTTTVTVVEGGVKITLYYTLPLTITAKTDSKTYDGDILTGEYTVTGALASDEDAINTAIGNPLTIGPDVDSQTYQAGTTGIPGYYAITNNSGTLTITPVEAEVVVTIVGNNHTDEYDGQAHTITGYEITNISNSLYTADDFTKPAQDAAVATATRTDEGTTNMTLSAADFANTSGNFSKVTFNVTPGYQTITKKNLTITAADDSKIYDGTPLTNYGYSNTALATGDTIESVTVTGSQTLVGKSDNVPSEALIVNAEGKAVTANYDIKYVNGTLEVRGIAPGQGDEFVVTKSVDTDISEQETMKAPDEGTRVYHIGDTVYWTVWVRNIYAVEKTLTVTETDGMEFSDYTGPSITLTLGPGDEAFITVWHVVTVEDVIKGSITNEVTVELDGEEYTAEDTVKTEQIAIEITADSDSKVYDGEPLTNDGWSKTAGELAKGDVITSVTVTGSQTLVGQSNNVPSDAVIKNAAGKVVTEAYDITLVDGTLKVTDEGIGGDDDEGLVVKKTADEGPYKLGEEVTFTITVKNIYDLDVTITLAEIDNVTLADDRFENVKPGETVETTATYTITEDDILKGSYTNTVTANIVEPELTVTADATVNTEEPNGHLTITKETTSTPANGETYALGEEITYKITVLNDGNLTITGITVTDELTGDEWPIKSLAPGETSEEFDASYKVTEADILKGEVVNVATATGDSPDPDEPDVPVDPGEDPEPTEDPKGHLTIKKVTTSTPADGKAYKLGETITYKITVTNDGNLTITNITVTDELTGDNWTIKSLEPGANEEFTAEYVVTEADILAGEVLNVATAKGTSPDPDDPDVPVDPGKDPEPTEDKKGHLTIKKVTTSTPADGKVYKLGETITYKITVTNDGNLTITNITVTDELTGDNWTIKSLEPGASEEFTAEYVVTEPDILAGEVLNVATAKGTSPDPDDPDVPVEPGEDPEPTEDKKGHLTIKKETTSTPTNGEAYVPGEKITYKITVTNDGNLTITNITVTDELTGDNWTIKSLEPGADEEFTAEYVVTEADVSAGKVVNVATAKGTSPDPDKTDVPVEPGEDPEPTTPDNKVTPVPGDNNETMDADGKSITVKYDGKAHTVNATATKAGSTITYSVDGGKTWTATAPSLTDVGSVEFQVKAENPKYKDAISETYTLAVVPREVILTSASAAKFFDGTPLRRNAQTHVTVTGDGFVPGEGATYNITGVQTDIGASNNTFIYALNEGTKGDNYTITQVYGRLMVMPEEVPLGIIGSVSLLFMSDTNLTAEGKKADAFKETYKWIKENNPRLGAVALVGTGNAVADRNDEDAWKLIKDELDKLEREPGYLPYYNIAGRNEVNGDEMDYEAYIEHKLCEVSEWNEYEDGQIWYQPMDENQLLLVGIGYQKTLDPETATEEELEIQEKWLRYVNNVISRYPEYTVVLLVNDFIEHDPDSLKDDGRLTEFGKLIERRIVAPNENVALVLCGNAEGTARWDKTYGERNVNAIMFNYQNDEENGLGFFRIVTLNGEAGTITVTTYSPVLDVDSYDEDHPEYDFYVIEDAFPTQEVQ